MGQVLSQYYEAGKHLNQGVINLYSDDIKLALVGSTYVPDLDLHSVWKVTATWAASQAYSEGQRVLPSVPAGFHYVCTQAGTSGASEPAWNTTEGQATNDNTAIWTTVIEVAYHEVAAGDGYTAGGVLLAGKTLTRSGFKTTFDAQDITFSALTKTFRYGILYIDDTKTDPQGGPNIIYPLLANILFDDTPADVEVVATDYVCQWSSLGLLAFGPYASF